MRSRTRGYFSASAREAFPDRRYRVDLRTSQDDRAPRQHNLALLASNQPIKHRLRQLPPASVVTAAARPVSRALPAAQQRSAGRSPARPEKRCPVLRASRSVHSQRGRYPSCSDDRIANHQCIDAMKLRHQHLRTPNGAGAGTAHVGNPAECLSVEKKRPSGRCRFSGQRFDGETRRARRARSLPAISAKTRSMDSGGDRLYNLQISAPVHNKRRSLDRSFAAVARGRAAVARRNHAAQNRRACRY